MNSKINLGAGKQLASKWTCIGLGGAAVEMDFEDCKKLPFPDESIDVAFTSHLIEHLTDKAVHNMFNEVSRALKPGGIFRIVTPDLDLHIRWLLKEDGKKFLALKRGRRPLLVGTKVEDLFVNSFMSFLSRDNKGHIKKRKVSFLSSDFWKVFHKTNPLSSPSGQEEFLHWMKSLLPIRNGRSCFRYLHINAFDFKRVNRFLLLAGLKGAKISKVRKSAWPELNKLNWDHFPERSVIVEVIK